jgi:hypothetical protein
LLFREANFSWHCPGKVYEKGYCTIPVCKLT